MIDETVKAILLFLWIAFFLRVSSVSFAKQVLLYTDNKEVRKRGVTMKRNFGFYWGIREDIFFV